MFRRDPSFQAAKRHIGYETVRHVDSRVDRFLLEPAPVRRAVLLLLRKDAMTHEPGNRGVGASALITGLVGVATIITAVVAAILAAFLGLSDQLTQADEAASLDLFGGLFQAVAFGVGVLITVALLMWWEGARRDRRRAVALLWYELFSSAQTRLSAGTPGEDDLLRGYLLRNTPRAAE